VIRSALALSVALVPSIALAQGVEGQVPAITGHPNQIAQAGITQGAQTAQGGTPSMSGTTVMKVPPGMPPPVQHRLSPDPTIEGKERAANVLSAQWRKRNERPTRGDDGTVKWMFGYSLPSVTCAPLMSCDIALEPGEIINNINAGDKERWSILPAVSGSGPERTTHIVVKPYDSGLVTDLLVYTNRRHYSIKLRSQQHEWTAQTAFSYPQQDMQTAWSNYGASMASSNTAPSQAGMVTYGSGGSNGGVQFYNLDGNASWKPLRAYATGGKTIIEFPSSIQFGSAPALVGGKAGGWFSSAREQTLIYRISGNSYVVDGVIDNAMLVLGVGSNQQRVDITRSK
jgi:P-type conjugative transfer protein TrbG